MNAKKRGSLLGWLAICLAGLWFTSTISSCGKSNIISAVGLNIRYEVINLSPDLGAVDLYINFLKVNPTQFIFSVNQGYFSIAALDTPYLFRTGLSNGAAGPIVLSRSDTLKRDLSYTLFITGSYLNNTLVPIFTVDTASLPAVGRGKIRFVNASPSGTAGYDVYANGTKIFSKLAYPKVSKYFELPNGNYDLKISQTGSTTTLKTLTAVQINDGELYTLYSSGYTTRPDSAAFNAAIITNR